VHKLLWLKKKQWWKVFEDPKGDKPPPKEWLPAGPFLLMLGDAGTGKSLIGRALSTYMTDIYKERGIGLTDVVCWRNEVIPSEPRISIHPSPKGVKLVRLEKKKEGRKGMLKRFLVKFASATLGSLGAFILFVGLYSIIFPWFTNQAIQVGQNLVPIQVIYDGNVFNWVIDAMKGNFALFMAGGSLCLSAFFINWIGRIFGGNMTGKGGIGGAENTKAPKVLIDNSSGRAPFIDATGHGSSQLFGSIAWDPYQTGGLGTPEHQRASAGDVHRAHLGVLYIDEIKNLKGGEAVTLLTVLEDGQLSIALRSSSGFHGGETSAMAVSTEPVPCMVFFIAAGNLDSLPMIHHALMDRIQGYGKTVYMNNTMPNTVENRRKCVQFIAQEIKRFNLSPFSREACIELIEESRRKAGRKDRLTTKFRPLISIVKTASVLATNDGKNVVDAKYVKEAIEEHCKPIQLQIIERVVENQSAYMIINPNAKPIIGQIHGLAVIADMQKSNAVGSVLPIRASIINLKKGAKGHFNVTGVDVKEESWIQNSILKLYHILHSIFQFKNPIGVHIDFAQAIGVEGPSAGVAMALALLSIVRDKPIKQDVAVTGEINIDIEGKVIITPVGGIHQKIKAAEKWGFKKVVIPKVNFEKDIKIKDYKIKVVGCETLKDYECEVLCSSQS